ncbi:hypothetical protein CICLE_v10003774mg [Citrus x clementina]|uniref:DUF4371 domain-containing protein n=1 Tax=Citrus clementina TaxID=85681 RepID=V4V0F0_CITCL|nr:hypothetical protein CICLE_v10003774mg [Citrus x clementina]
MTPHQSMPHHRSMPRHRSVYVNSVVNSNVDKRDLGLCRQIWSYLVNQQDEIQRAYIRACPYQLVCSKNPQSGDHGCNFQSLWYSLFPIWLEYSIANDAAFYGFRTWGKVRGEKCTFLNHDLMNQSQHIQQVFHKYTTQDVADNQLRLKFLIRASQYLALQGSALKAMMKHIYSMKVRKTIREEIGDAKFCKIVDKSRDESKKEQMAIVLRFVDKDGIVREQFFGLVHVSETSAQTLKKEIFCLGYDGASNMRGEWNGLKVLILKDCSYAYYIHLVIPLHQFFTKLTYVVNIVSASCKRNDELKRAKANEIVHMLVLDELETSKGLNQIRTLQRVVSSLINMFSATCEVLINIVEDGVTYASRGDADATYEVITSFEFVFVLHLMKNITAITDLLSQKMRNKEWQNLLENVISFRKACNIDIPDINARYIVRQGRAHDQDDNFTIEQQYRVNIFYAAIDSQLQELNIRFNDSSVELLMLSSALDLREGYNSFGIDNICQLVDKFYRDNFTDNEKIYLRRDIAKKISMESIIDDFRDMKEHKVRF